MVFDGRRYSVLIVSASEKFNTALCTLLPAMRYHPITQVKEIASAQRLLSDMAYDFVIINTPLPDDFGTRFAIGLADKKNTVCLMFVKSEQYADVFDRVMSRGVFTLTKPSAPSAVRQALDFMAAARERLRCLEKKTATMEEKMADIRLANRAKWLLISHEHMTEDEAHKTIEKQAMDRCVTRRVIAEEIVGLYSKES